MDSNKCTPGSNIEGISPENKVAGVIAVVYNACVEAINQNGGIPIPGKIRRLRPWRTISRSFFAVCRVALQSLLEDLRGYVKAGAGQLGKCL